MPGAVHGPGRDCSDTPNRIDREVRRSKEVDSAAGSCGETQPGQDDGETASSIPATGRRGNTEKPVAHIETSDILICGTCRQLFATVALLRKHKSDGCRKKVACKCTPRGLRMRRGENNVRDQTMPRRWLCRECREEFDGPWPLMYHAGAVHRNVIYRRHQQNKRHGAVGGSS
ncbi:Hypp7702 [Branchiostoma lanceolatum]|uniref:Hypp7702 protein n=1 Tax=Branchiostoma lanceolatum TaxID=7740 RepID=A0A8K0ECW4_BRALA|nr:Hypp7702 [Branchiostoma lanceolatum]